MRADSPSAARLAGFPVSIFTEMTRLAVEHGAVNLGQGFPDFPAPDFVKEAARAAIAADQNQYAPAPGLLRLRQAIAQDFARHGVAVDAEREVTVTAGATEAICDTILAVVDPGDEVVVFEPCYDSYLPAIQMAGGQAKLVRLEPPDWHFDEGALAAAFSPRTKLVIINTPHNPTGKVFSADELDLIARHAIAADALVLSDEVYAEITFAGARHVPIASRPGMAARTISVGSLGKTFSVTGWKIGWAIAAAPLTAAVRNVHQFVTFCNGTPLQQAAADALTHAAATGFYDRLRAEYTDRCAHLGRVLDDAGLRTLPIAGAYFLLADIGVPPFAGRFADDVAFCRFLTTEVGVAAIPPSALYLDAKTAPKLARFCFAKSDATLTAAAGKLAQLRVTLGDLQESRT